MYESSIPNGSPGALSIGPAPPAANGEHRPAGRLGGPSPNGGHSPLVEAGAAPAPLPNGGNGRDTRGRFAKGNPGGPGNPFGRQVAGLRRALCAAVSEADIHALAGQLVERAGGGDLGAIKLVFAYTIGQPAEAVDPDTLDFQEWQLYRQASAHTEELTVLLTKMPHGLACELVRTVLPCLSQHMATQFLDTLEAGSPGGPHEPCRGAEAEEP